MSEDITSDMQTTTQVLLQRALSEDDWDRYWDIVMVLHLRGTEEVFCEARRMCFSDDPDQRALGADILGQLGAPNRPFAAESAGIFLGMLEKETDTDVLSAVVSAVGHLDYPSPKFVQPLVRLASHEDPQIRKAVAIALSGYDDSSAIETIIKLSSDKDRDVRDWATHFGLDSLSGPDTPEILEALLRRVRDEVDDEIRAEALLGLAHRKDARVVEPLIMELERQISRKIVYDYLFEAATDAADPRLCPALLAFKEQRGGDFFYLEDAIIACKCCSE